MRNRVLIISPWQPLIYGLFFGFFGIFFFPGDTMGFFHVFLGRFFYDAGNG
jgi:hypothetical protein